MTKELHSTTNGFFATIPLKLIRGRNDIDTFRAWDTDGHYRDVPKAKLISLIDAHRVRLFHDENGEYYVPSVDWTKFF